MFQTAILLAGTVFCLLGCFAGLSLYGKRIASPDTFSPVPVIIFCVVVLIASAAAFLYEWQDYEFVSDLSAASFAAAGTATVVLLVCSFLRIPGWFRLLLIAALSSVIVFFFSAGSHALRFIDRRVFRRPVSIWLAPHRNVPAPEGTVICHSERTVIYHSETAVLCVR